MYSFKFMCFSPFVSNSHNKRVMIPNSETRKLLQAYVKNDNFDNAAKHHLYALLRVHCPSLCNFLHWVDKEKNTTGELEPQIAALLNAISCNSPLCALIHPDEELLSILRELTLEDCGRSVFANPSKMKTLQNMCPILFRFVTILDQSIPEPCKYLLEDMISKAKSPFISSTLPAPPQPPSSTLEKEAHPLSYFPGLPLRRKRATFVVDAKRAAEGAACTKLSRGHPSLLPGIFTIFCQHGGCFMTLLAVI